MEKTSGMMFKYMFKRIIYFNCGCKDIIIKTVKAIKEEISTINNHDTFECIIYKDFIEIYCNNENIIKMFERLLISKLPNNTLVYPHNTVHSVNFEDIRKFQEHSHLLLGQCIFQAIQVIQSNLEFY